MGRFINIDNIDYIDPETINGLNLYAYCNNNPVNYYDPSGHLFFTILLIGIVAGAAIGATVNGVQAYKDGARGWEVVSAVAKGAVVGGLIGAAAGAVAGAGAVLISSGMAALGGGLGAAALAGGGVVGGSAVVVGGGAILAGGALTATGVVGGLLGLNVWFAKGDGPRMGHHQHENQMWDEAMRQLDIKDKDLRQRLHHKNRKKPYANTLKKLLKNLREILAEMGL